jgi:hypothetical protein
MKEKQGLRPYPSMSDMRVVRKDGTGEPVRVMKIEFLAKDVSRITPQDGEPFVINYFDPDNPFRIEVYGPNGWE